MKFKLDENFGLLVLQLFRQHGYDVTSVLEERLSGQSDTTLFHVCVDEGRCLVSLDLDFSDVTRFPPQGAGGIVVLRLPRHPSPLPMERVIRQFLATLATMTPERKLWIVEIDRIRVHQQSKDAPDIGFP